LIDDAAAKRNQAPLVINGIEIKTSLEPCQHYERNICLKIVAQAMNKYI